MSVTGPTESEIYLYLGTSFYLTLGRDATPTQCMVMGWVICTNYLV